nr:MAG TPA: hypothetical protein [Caudoviricetes sp.]
MKDNDCLIHRKIQHLWLILFYLLLAFELTSSQFGESVIFLPYSPTVSPTFTDSISISVSMLVK